MNRKKYIYTVCSSIAPAPAQIASRAMRLHDADFELLKVSQLQRYQDALVVESLMWAFHGIGVPQNDPKWMIYNGKS